MAVIAFHSLEDREVKQAFRALAASGFRLLTRKPVRPGDTIRVHFRNNDSHYKWPHSMHPHGVRYDSDSDGGWMADAYASMGISSTDIWGASSATDLWNQLSTAVNGGKADPQVVEAFGTMVPGLIETAAQLAQSGAEA